MSSSLDLTRDWLRNVLKPYPARDRVLPEVMDVLTNRRTLAVKTDAFTFDNGQTALLVLLHGTLPINFRGATYHIPINVWIPHDYPRMPPLAFVVPTKEMGVRKGREVEPSGRVAETVVQTWWNGWEDKSVEKLLGQLTSIFSATPPVYAKPTETPRVTSNGFASSSQSGPTYSGMSNAPRNPDQPPPPPARPFSGPSPAAMESLPRYQSEQTPPPHPFPQQQVMQPQANPIRQMSSPPVPNRPSPGPPRMGSLGPASPGGGGGPVLPQRPYIPQIHGAQPMSPIAGPSFSGPRYSQPPPPQAGWQAPGGPSAMQSAQGMPTHHQAPQAGQYGPQNPMQNGQYAPHQQAQHQRTPSGQFGPQPPPHMFNEQPLQQTQSTPQSSAQSQPSAQTRRPMEDLLSSPNQSTSDLPPSSKAVQNPGDPPPLPPSKPPPPSLLHLHSILLPHLNASLPPLLHSLETNRQHLRERHEDLVSGEPAIRDEMARLEAVKKVCDSVGRKLGEAVEKGQERVAELEARGEVSVDEVVCGISIVHNQLIDLVAEDNAIEDTIYHMTRALDNERVDLDRYMKAIRSLAREQYMKRALIERILQGMGQTQGW